MAIIPNQSAVVATFLPPLMMNDNYDTVPRNKCGHFYSVFSTQFKDINSKSTLIDLSEGKHSNNTENHEERGCRKKLTNTGKKKT